MKKLRMLAFLLISTSASTTAFCQHSSDSTELISVRKWQLNRLIQNTWGYNELKVYTAKLVDESIKSNKVIAAQDSLLNVRAQIIKDQAIRITTSDARLENQTQLTKIEKKQKNKYKIITFTMIGVGIYVIVRGATD